MKKKIPKAAALKYDENAPENAPVISAAGQGKVAQEIIKLAQKHNIHIHQDPDLVEILAKTGVGTEIPPEVYKAVAEILIFVYRLNGKEI